MVHPNITIMTKEARGNSFSYDNTPNNIYNKRQNLAAFVCFILIWIFVQINSRCRHPDRKRAGLIHSFLRSKNTLNQRTLGCSISGADLPYLLYVPICADEVAITMKNF